MLLLLKIIFFEVEENIIHYHIRKQSKFNSLIFCAHRDILDGGAAYPHVIY